MFTGIVEELGSVRHIERRGDAARIEIACTVVREDAALGASIAVNGCCMTVVELGDGWWAADAQPETLARTTIGELAHGDAVNLERPVRLGDRLGGHLVQGHVDGVGHVVDRRPSPDGSAVVTMEIPADLRRYVVEKGSLTVDGVSLTVAGTDALAPDGLTVALIPHTLAHTTLGSKGKGDRVHVECDLIGKWVKQLLPSLGR
jgi:riboflavin synthase